MSYIRHLCQHGACLELLGGRDPSALSVADASQLIDAMVRARDAQPPSAKMDATLKRFGLQAKTFREAMDLLNVHLNRARK